MAARPGYDARRTLLGGPGICSSSGALGRLRTRQGPRNRGAPAGGNEGPRRLGEMLMSLEYID
jgi:hypothetical protein